MNYSYEMRIFVVLVLLLLVGIGSTHYTLFYNAGPVWAKRTQTLEIHNCEKLEFDITVLLGDSLTIQNLDSQPHAIVAFGEELRVEAYSEGILPLNQYGPKQGKLACDKNEIININLLKKEIIKKL